MGDMTNPFGNGRGGLAASSGKGGNDFVTNPKGSGTGGKGRDFVTDPGGGPQKTGEPPDLNTRQSPSGPKFTRTDKAAPGERGTGSMGNSKVPFRLNK